MAHNSFFDNVRSFFGLRTKPPSNDFRNPIWSSDDEDDGDDLYSRSHNMDVFEGAIDLHQEFGRQMHDMLRTFGTMFGDFKSLFHEDHMDSFTTMDIPDDPESDSYSGKNIRDYYLKPGYHSHTQIYPKEDIDLDGKISSNEISGLLKQNKDPHSEAMTPFNGHLIPGRSFCQTIITTSVTRADGTIETRKIIKKGNEVIEETTTSTMPDSRGPHPHLPGLDQISSSGHIYKTIMSELSSLFRNYH